MSILEFKKKYNSLLARERKAEQYFENPERTPEEIDKWLPELQKIIIQLSLAMQEYKRLTGKEMTKEEVLNGFN